MTTFFDNLLDSSETIVTIASAFVLYAIVAGPMSYLKWRYKLLVFCTATSILGATLNRFAIFFPGQNEDVLNISRMIVLVSRIGVVISGTYLFVNWVHQCDRIKAKLLMRELAKMGSKDTDKLLSHSDITVDSRTPVEV